MTGRRRFLFRKSSLKNARLETAITPTTSVIFEIRFGNNEQRAEIIHDDGKVTEITDINSLKNYDDIKHRFKTFPMNRLMT